MAEVRTCPLFDFCKNTAKSKDWACGKRVEQRLKMCCTFYTACCFDGQLSGSWVHGLESVPDVS